MWQYTKKKRPKRKIGERINNFHKFIGWTWEAGLQRMVHFPFQPMQHVVPAPLSLSLFLALCLQPKKDHVSHVMIAPLFTGSFLIFYCTFQSLCNRTRQNKQFSPLHLSNFLLLLSFLVYLYLVRVKNNSNLELLRLLYGLVQ